MSGKTLKLRGFKDLKLKELKPHGLFIFHDVSTL